MGKPKDSGRVDLHKVFLRVQQQMLASLAASDVFEHPTACGDAAEQPWIKLFNRYLPTRYRAANAFIVDADGNRSRQIDVAVYDQIYSPLLFDHDSGIHLPAESVYAVFEVKHTLTARWFADAGSKAASVRKLRRTSAPLLSAGALQPPKPPAHILAGVLSLDAIWKKTFPERVCARLQRMPLQESLDLGCSLRHGAFEVADAFVHFSPPEEALIGFFLTFLHRLQKLGTTPAIDLAEYSRTLALSRATLSLPGGAEFHPARRF
jgi:hypothetical protein